MQRLKKVLSMVLVCTILMTSTPIYAKDNDNDYYAQLFKQIVDLVKTQYYFSDELTEEALFKYAIEGIFENLDPYSEFMEIVEKEALINRLDPSFVGVGMRISEELGNIIVVDVFENTPAYSAGVKKGDIFYSVDHTIVEDYIMDDLLELLLGEEGTEVEIEFLRNEEIVKLKMQRERYDVPTVRVNQLEELAEGVPEVLLDQVGYIKLTSFAVDSGYELEQAIEGLKSEGKAYLILDLRNNTGGYVSTAVDVANLLIPAGEFVTFIDNQGQEKKYYSELENPPFQIVTLINELSASASEITAAAIQDSGVGVLLGETTYGKGVAQYLYDINDQYYVKLTVEEFLSRDGKTINDVGVSPDYLVEVPSYINSQYRLFINDENEGVLMTERVLAYLGYDAGMIDEVYDESTFEAIKSFQKDMGLFPYGVCDFTTQKTLNEQLQLRMYTKDLQLLKAIDVIESKLIGENIN